MASSFPGDTSCRAPALVVSAPGGLVLAANAAFCQHTGYADSAIVGMPLQQLQPMTVSGSLISALQAQQAGSGFSMHEVPLRLHSGAEERATIRASPLYCVETGTMQGFSLLILASSSMKPGEAANEYLSPAMPAASVEGLRNVAPSVLRLLQICGEDASTAWKGLVPGAGTGAPQAQCTTQCAQPEGERASEGTMSEHGSGGGAEGGGHSCDEDDDLDEGGSRSFVVPPPLPVNEASARSAWSVLCASVLQRSMFSNVLITRQCAPDEHVDATPDTAAALSAAQRPPPKDPAHYIWHVSPGLEQLLGHSAEELLGHEINALYDRSAAAAPPSASAMDVSMDSKSGSEQHCVACSDASGAGGAAQSAPPFAAAGFDAVSPSSCRQKELHEAVSASRNCLIEVILPTKDGGAPRFCLAYVLPLVCSGPRASSVAVAFLDVHHSLPYMQRHMEARGFGDCDLYTFVKFSLLNCLVTDPSVRTSDPAQRNPIVFASAGFGVMCGCAPHEVMHRNCRFLQSPSFVSSNNGTTTDTSFPQPEAVMHMSAALDARHESLTYLHNFRKDGTPFANLLFMTPILNRFGDGVLFWIGVQHPLGEAPAAGINARPAVAGEAEANLHAQLRSAQQALHSLQLQELYGSYTAMAQRTALLIQAADGAVTTICRLCEHHVLADAMPSHTQYCKIVTQCKGLAACSDTTLARQLVKLNGASSASAIFGSASTPASLVVDLLRTYTSVLLAITASTTLLPVLDTLPAELDRIVAAASQPNTAAIWADIRAAGQRKLAALQHAYSWAGELQQTIVHMPTSDPLSQGQAPSLQDFEMVREIQRGSHATVWLVRKKQTRDVFAMKIIDRKSGRLNRLHTERKVLFLCSSPFVVKTFFAFEDADNLCLVMERLHQDCKNVLQSHGAMSEAQGIPLLADMVLALEHLHTCGIVHRDLKPENMLLTPSGRLKLADFGLSHIAQRLGTRPIDDVAKDPSIVGTPFYMAPETIRGKSRGVETAADWWSFGVIMYEFLLGFPPFQGGKVGEIYRSILSLAFAAPIAHCAVSAEAADLISRILVSDPRRRLVGATTMMAHPWFARIDWHSHAHSAGVQIPRMNTPSQPHANSSQSLHALAAAGGTLGLHGAPSHATPGMPPKSVLAAAAAGIGGSAMGGAAHSAAGPSAGSSLGHLRTASGGSKTSLGGAEGDATRSVHSMGMESERSAASTNLADLVADGGETSAHLDNLMGLNQRACHPHPNLQPNHSTHTHRRRRPALHQRSDAPTRAACRAFCAQVASCAPRVSNRI